MVGGVRCLRGDRAPLCPHHVRIFPLHGPLQLDELLCLMWVVTTDLGLRESLAHAGVCVLQSVEGATRV